MKVLVAGAAGYLGTELVRVLSARGHRVVGLDLDLSRLENNAEYLSNAIGADMTRKAELKGKCDGFDAVISTVGLEYPQKTIGYFDIDYQANLNLLKEAERAGVKRFLYVSVILADMESDDLPPIVVAKRLFEKELMQSDLKWVVFRPTGYFKDIVNIFLKGAKKGKIRLIGDGQTKFNPLHPVDFSNFIADNLEADNQVFEVGGPEVYSYLELGKIAFEIVGKPPKFSFMTPGGFMKFAKVMKLFKPMLYPIFHFGMWCMTNDMIGKKTGTHKIVDTLTKNRG